MVDEFDMATKNKTHPKIKTRADISEISLNLLAVNSMGFSIPVCMLLLSVIGAPQCGQDVALSDICLPHSMQSINAMIPSYLKMGLIRFFSFW